MMRGERGKNPSQSHRLSTHCTREWMFSVSNLTVSYHISPPHIVGYAITANHRRSQPISLHCVTCLHFFELDRYFEEFGDHWCDGILVMRRRIQGFVLWRQLVRKLGLMEFKKNLKRTTHPTKLASFDTKCKIFLQLQQLGVILRLQNN